MHRGRYFGVSLSVVCAAAGSLLGSGCGATIRYTEVAVPEVSLSAVEYDVLVRNSLPLAELRDKAEQATLSLQFDITEEDLFDDDHYRWVEKAVLLGSEGTDLVLLTTRCVLDPYAPGRDAQTVDGVGGREFLPARLTIRAGSGTRVSLGYNVDSRQTRDVRVVFPNSDVDLALLYVPASSEAGQSLQALPQMGLAAPTQVVATVADEVQRLFGFDFVIRSRTCDDLVLGQRNTTSPLGKILKLVLVLAAWEFAIEPLGLELADAISSGSILEGLTQFAEAAAVSPSLPLQLLDPNFAFGNDGSLQVSADQLGDAVTRLLLVNVLGLSAGQREIVGEFLDVALGDHPLQAATFETMAGLVSQIFVPDRQMNVNLELIARGLAKLDTNNPVAVQRYPMFVEAAREAVRTGAGFASEWAEDSGYVQALDALAQMAADSPLAELAGP